MGPELCEREVRSSEDPRANRTGCSEVVFKSNDGPNFDRTFILDGEGCMVLARLGYGGLQPCGLVTIDRCTTEVSHIQTDLNDLGVSWEVQHCR